MRNTKLEMKTTAKPPPACLIFHSKETLISYVRKAMTKLCIKILVESDSAIESAFP